jgi:hypothetical protein
MRLLLLTAMNALSFASQAPFYTLPPDMLPRQIFAIIVVQNTLSSFHYTPLSRLPSRARNKRGGSIYHLFCRHAVFIQPASPVDDCRQLKLAAYFFLFY